MLYPYNGEWEASIEQIWWILLNDALLIIVSIWIEEPVMLVNKTKIVGCFNP